MISNEAHRSISGNARAVFDYFVGYKLGLTATPRDYLRGFSKTGPKVHDPRGGDRDKRSTSDKDRWLRTLGSGHSLDSR